MLRKVLSILFLSFAVTVCLREVMLSHTKVPSEENWFLFWPGISAKKKNKSVVKPVAFTCEFSTLVHYISLTELWHRPNVEDSKFAVCSLQSASLYILETQIQRIH